MLWSTQTTGAMPAAARAGRQARDRRPNPWICFRTAQLNVHFLSKGEGNVLIGRGRALHLGQRMGYGEAEVIDAEGRLLARASGAFIVLPAPGAF